MKRLLLLFFITAIPLAGIHAQASFRADERFELTSIAARLAGYGEYMQTPLYGYGKAIDEYFAPYREHGLISHLQSMRRSNGISYDAIPTAARALVLKDGGVSISPEADMEKLYEIDSRWTETNFKEFVRLLDDFYRKSDFHGFYEDNLQFYAEGEALVNSFAEVDTAWFRSYYGKPLKSPELYLSFVNGPSNYAITDSGISPGFGIVMGMWFDPAYYTAENISIQQKCAFTHIIIHELCHNFTNPLSYEYKKQMAPASNRVFFEDDVMRAMFNMAYGEPSVMTGEWLNNLCVNMYFREKGLLYPQDYGKPVSEEADVYGYMAFIDAYKGFFWMNSSIEMMDKFYANRDKYQYFKDFMPELVKFYDKFSKNIRKEREKYEALYPKVTDFSVDTSESDVIKLKFAFSCPMNPRFVPSGLLPFEGDAMPLPEIMSARYKGDNVLVVCLDKDALEKGGTYGGALDAMSFRSDRAYVMMSGNYQFEFKYE